MVKIEFTQEEIQDSISEAVTESKSCVINGNFDRAEALLKQVVLIDPKHLEALKTLTPILIGRGKNTDAIEYYELLLNIDPDDKTAINNLAICLIGNGEYTKAVRLLKKGIELDPVDENNYNNLAVAYKHIPDYNSALTVYRMGLDALPGCQKLWHQYAIALAENSQFQEALEAYEQAPDLPDAIFNKSLLHLLLGEYEQGWKLYPSRFVFDAGFMRFKNRFAKPEWRNENVNGETVLVYCEQGIGDTIQFLRYLPFLKERGAKVIFESPPELTDLLGKCQGIDQVISKWKKNHLPDYDFHTSICDLPLKLEKFEPFFEKPYIGPTGSVPKGYFNDYEGYQKIGICWAGNPGNKQDESRSCPLRHFEAIQKPGRKLFSFQKDIRPRVWNGKVVDLTVNCDRLKIVDLSDLLIDFNYTAAVLKEMDLLVTVDTAVAHLAGAMGVPCYLILPVLPDWRWGLQESTTPWYPSIKIIREANYELSLQRISMEIEKSSQD